jgi:hypothetical protein
MEGASGPDPFYPGQSFDDTGLNFGYMAGWFGGTPIKSMRFGHFGSYSTGVISFADINANEEGYLFYDKLYSAYQKGQKLYPFQFSVFDYKYTGFNEQTVKNQFVPGLKVDDTR